MKARVKETGEIVDETAMVSTLGDDFYLRELEPILEDVEVSDYWTRLEHQYAGMAMQGILGNQTYTKNLLETSTSAKDARDIIVDASCYLAHALMEKLKEERK